MKFRNRCQALIAIGTAQAAVPTAANSNATQTVADTEERKPVLPKAENDMFQCCICSLTLSVTGAKCQT